MATIQITALRQLTYDALIGAGATTTAAHSTADALIYAEAQGTASHGVSRVPQYVGHLSARRILGDAVPSVAHVQGAVAIVDAADGLAFPACEMAIDHAIETARELGIAFVAIKNSYHFGAAIYHLEPVARARMVGLALSNSPAAMAPWGGKRPLFGTNPIAAIFPREGHDPLAIDLALSEVARGKLMVAAKNGSAIPTGWAFDESGAPTTDPAKGLKGSMAPAGGVKGAMLALTIELLVTALTGARFGFEADSFFDVHGNQPRIGHAFLVINPAAMGGRDLFNARIETLVAAMLADGGVRLPGARRYGLQRAVEQGGVQLPDALLAQLTTLAQVQAQ
jgi:(2R)-3-sulfolactate dehydrogenase (NADP+)